MEEKLSAIVYGVPKKKLRVEFSTDKSLQMVSKNVESRLNYKEVLQNNIEKKLCPQNKMLQVSSKKEDTMSWQCSVVCKRKSINSSWIEISKELSAILDKEVVLYPFQCNKALLFCSSKEEAEWVARHKKITVNIQEEVSLCRWKQKCNFHGKRKFVSFGGWIEIEGLPFNLWNKETLKQIGDAYVIGNFEAFYVRIKPATLSNRLSVHEEPHWKTARNERKAGKLPYQFHTGKFSTRENQKPAVDNFPASLKEAAAGSLPRKNQNEGTGDRITGECGAQKQRNLTGNGRGTKEAWETADENTQVEILKEARLVDDDKAENPVCVLMGQQNKVQPLGEFKNRKCVDVDKTVRGKSLDSGFAVLDQKNREKRSSNDGRLRVADWAFGKFSKTGGPAEHKGIQSEPKDKKDDPKFFVNGNGYEGNSSALKSHLLSNSQSEFGPVLRFKKLSPADFGVNKYLETVEEHGNAKKSVLQDSDAVSEGQEEAEEFLAEIEAEKHKEQENFEEITNDESSHLNCVLEEEFRELVGMCSTTDFLEETRLENEDFAEFASVLNENSQESSDSEEYVPDSSSDDEEVVSVLDQHEGILKDFFQEKDAQVDLKAQRQQAKEDFSGSIKTLKKVKIKDAAAHKCSKNFASTSEGKSMERMGRKKGTILCL
ncbi:hypothetical protein M0R45_027273 [Rubus argutus]|uniref:DUF4283 domain-containing protein n=1 Tax=Rubus argutus TaxID=59490 RepID=A0AAW1X1N4_RUBAR